MKSTPDKISHKDVKKMNDDKKVATYGTFLENDISAPNEESEESVTNDTFSEDDIAELDEETDIDNDFSENDTPEPDEPATEITLVDFIHEQNYPLPAPTSA